MKGLNYSLCMKYALDNDSIMPIDCLNYMIEVYGKRIDSLSFKYICSVINDMMYKVTDISYMDLIIETVEENFFKSL